MNVYAPTERRDREGYFHNLLAWDLHTSTSMIVGDFNCVQSPALDRYGQHRATRSESPALDALINTSGLVDARVIRDHAEDDAENDFDDHFTYWEGAQASRIDRFYVPAHWVDRVQWVSTKTPPQLSDHQEVVLHLRAPKNEQLHPTHRRVTYPIQSSHPDRVIAELVEQMDNMAVGQGASTTS